jgi:XTP/dITP diphosphohydrolase
MLTLATSNPAKYAPFAGELERLRIELQPPHQPLPEVQSLRFTETLAAKARAAAAMFGRPVLVDDAGLVLTAYPQFPGPLTSTVLRSLGVDGLRRLLHGVSDRAVMECHLGCWVGDALRSWSGLVHGRIDGSRHAADEAMILTDLFVPDERNHGANLKPQPQSPKRELAGVQGQVSGNSQHPARLLHRARALAALEADIFDLHLETSATPPVAVTGGETHNSQGNQTAHSCARAMEPGTAANRPAEICPFCAEFENDGLSIFANMMGARLPSRIVYEDEYFIVMPPLGEFMEGGLLLLTREHILSLAHLPPERFEHLERLLQAIHRTLVKRWGVAPLVFEHGPAPEWSKGVCCVDHAHLNIFPARAEVRPHLGGRMSMALSSLAGLARLRRAEFGYLLVQENDGNRWVYDGQNAPTQLVRRIVTSQLGLTDRWHWRDYLGLDELAATYQALRGQIRL